MTIEAPEGFAVLSSLENASLKLSDQTHDKLAIARRCPPHIANCIVPVAVHEAGPPGIGRSGRYTDGAA